MSHPFAFHPSVQEYLAAAVKRGCKVHTSTFLDKDGRPRAHYEITCGEKHVLIVDHDLTDRLPPSAIGHYDRRLGLQSGFSDGESN